MTDPARRWRTAALAATSLLPVVPAVAAEPTIAELLQRIEAQEQKIAVLERRLEIREEADTAAAGSAAVVKASDRGFSIQSADGQSQIRLRGLLHFDGRYMLEDDTSLTDQWQATRIRPILEGTLGGIYDFRFTPDFGQGRTVIQDAYVTGRFQPGFQLTAGKFKMPVGLERLQSATDIRFVARGFPTGLAPNRDLGIQAAGKLLSDRVDYAVAFANGSNDGSSSEAFGDVDLNDDKEWAGRVFAQPFAESDSFYLRGLGMGLAVTWTDQDGTAAQPLLPAYRTPAQATFFLYRTGTNPTLAAGERTRVAPQLYYSFGSFGLLGEYTEVSQDVARTTETGTREGTVDSTAWQVALHWFMTGEEESFRGFRPNSVFAWDRNTWGAFELVGRYQELRVSDDAFAGGDASFADPAVAARKASGYTLGLNWYLNQNVKWVLNYEHTTFDGGAPDGEDRPTEQALLTRVAVGF
jgi:phosphate-selective porin OprO/OprP